MSFPLTRIVNREQLSRWFKLPESIRAFENLQRDVIELFSRKPDDAPADGAIYGRQDAEWVPVPAGGGGSGGGGSTEEVVAGANVAVAETAPGVFEVSVPTLVKTLEGLSGDIDLQGSGGITITVLPGNIIQIAAAGAGVSSLNLKTGAVDIVGATGRVAVTNVDADTIGVDLVATGITPGTYPAATVTCDAYGRITGIVASAGVIASFLLLEAILFAATPLPNQTAVTTFTQLNHV